MTRWFWAGLAIGCGAAFAWAAAVDSPPVADHIVATGMVAQIALDGPIGPAAAEYFDDAAKRAADDGAVAIVLRLDTPGGLSDSMRQIISGMLASKIPLLVYVAPSGARAASAGTYILYAGQIAAMAPATHVGAATPVSLGGVTPMPPPVADHAPAPADASSHAKPDAGLDAESQKHAKPEADRDAESQKPAKPHAASDAESQKVVNDSIAYMRSLAQLRGRNAEWAEDAVRGAATLTASEALQKHVIDFVATDVAALLAQADGRQVQVADHPVTLKLKDLTVRDYAPDARLRFLAIITNPTIAYLLLLAGIFGLFLEATHPGAMLPGIVGGICLLIGLYALQLLPVNYAGLALMALGIGLLVAEALNPTIGALGIGGVISFVVGSIMLMKTGAPGYTINLGIIAGIAVSAALLLALILRLVFRIRRARQVTGDDSTLSDVAELLEPVSADGNTWAIVRGERWQVHSDTALPAGTRVRIVRRHGLLLWVVPE